MKTLEDDFLAIYETILGDGRQASWVKDAWNDDTGIARGYELLWQSRENLAERLGLEDFSRDADMEAIMEAFDQIQKDLCRRMFYCTLHYAVKKYK